MGIQSLEMTHVVEPTGNIFKLITRLERNNNLVSSIERGVLNLVSRIVRPLNLVAKLEK